MLLSTFPQTPELLKHIAEIFLKDDKEYVDAFNAFDGDDLKTGGHCVGLVKIKEPDKTTVIHVWLDDVSFTRGFPLSSDKTAQEALIKTTDGEFRIIMNKRSYDLYMDLVTRDIVFAALTHEVGHFLLDHSSEENKKRRHEDHLERNPVAWVDRYHEGIEERVIKPLLDGYYGDEIELEADIVAVCIVGIAPVLAMRAMESRYSQNIGVRMMNHNRIHHLLHLLETVPTIFKAHQDVHLEVMILTQQELEDLKKEIPSDNPPTDQ